MGADYPEIRPMKRKRRHLTAVFKARVTAGAFKGEKTIQQIARENDISHRTHASEHLEERP